MSKNTNIDLVAPKELGFQLLEAIMIEATIEEIRALMEHGASINIKDYSGETPLYKACLRNNAELATFLIEHEADVNIRNNDGWTPLHRACYHNNTQLTALLIEHGAGINIRNNNGWTPLHHACYHNNPNNGLSCC